MQKEGTAGERARQWLAWRVAGGQQSGKGNKQQQRAGDRTKWNTE